MAMWASVLRPELAERATAFAVSEGLSCYPSRGAVPTTLFLADPAGTRHGNFIERSYRAILANPAWAQRLDKAHSQRKALPEDRREAARELDSCNSSDALLMNCFCYPGAATQIFERLLPDLPTGVPEFGVDGKVPLIGNGVDTTELDMRAGSVIFESKLTESDFTERPIGHVKRYRDFATVFETQLLPQGATTYSGYQLIRNFLAVSAHGHHFVLLCDGRRPDLLHEWWQVHGAIASADLRRRCTFLFWQEVAAVCQRPLRSFLQVKYGL